MEILSCVFVMIGVIIGAGFASGREMYTFFFVYGSHGIWGMAISCFLIGYVIYKSLRIIQENQICHYHELIGKLTEKIQMRYISLKFILNFVMNVFLVISFFVMCAGFVAFFQQEFQVNQIFASVLIASICYFVLRKNAKGIFSLNAILIPMMIIMLILLGGKATSKELQIPHEIGKRQLDSQQYFICKL